MLIVLMIADDGKSIIYNIYGKNHKRMLYSASKIIGSRRAEDIVHDIFVRLIEKNYDLELLTEKPGQYFVVMARNHSINALKQEKTRFVSIDDELSEDDIFMAAADSPESMVIHNDAKDRLVELIRKLTPATRQIFELKYILGYSNIEIADMLGISQSAVSTRIDKAKKKLKEMLESGEANVHR